MNNSEKKEWEKEKQKRKKDFFASRNKKAEGSKSRNYSGQRR